MSTEDIKKKYKRQKISGIILMVIGIVPIQVGYIYIPEIIPGLRALAVTSALIVVGSLVICLGGGLWIQYVRRLKKEIINQLPSIFDTVNSIKIEKLSEILLIRSITAKRIIFSNKTELLELGLDLKYEKGLIRKIE